MNHASVNSVVFHRILDFKTGLNFHSGPFFLPVPVVKSSPGQKKSNNGPSADGSVIRLFFVRACGVHYFRAMQDQSITGWETKFITYLKENTHTKDGSHDLGHFQRVWKAAQYINQEEGGIADPLILLTGAYFHDLVSLPKNSPERSASSRLSAERTVALLKDVFTDFPPDKIEGVRHAIHAHSFSAQVAPLTSEAKILQDADRMEALGAIGLARVFYTAGQLSQRLFDAEDPLALAREPNDSQYSLDHFQLKLFKLPALMNTATGKRLAEEKVAYLRQYLRMIESEIKGKYDG